MYEQGQLFPTPDNEADKMSPEELEERIKAIGDNALQREYPSYTNLNPDIEPERDQGQPKPFDSYEFWRVTREKMDKDIQRAQKKAEEEKQARFAKRQYPPHE